MGRALSGLEETLILTVKDNVEQRPVLRARLIMGAAAAAGACFTLAVVLAPNVRFAYQSPEAHAAIETAATIVGGLVAYLFAGRARRTGALGDIALAGALTLLVLSNLSFSLLPSFATSPSERFATWAPVVGRLLAGFGLVYAAWAPERRLSRPDLALRRVLWAAAGVTILIGLVVAALGTALPTGFDPDLTPEHSFRPVLDTAPSIVVIQLVAMLLYATAAVGVLRQVERHPEQLRVWLAAGLVLGAFARLNYFLFPSLYSEYVYAGDFLRLGFYLLLLWGAAQEITSYQRRMRESAVFQERRRLARELHDGLAAELAYITSQSRNAQRSGNGDATMSRIVSAAERALDEARSALSALTRPVDETLDASVAREAARLADRADVDLRLELQPGVRVADDVREALLRIVREAVNNAIRHGRPETVTVSLECAHGVTVCIADDGAGFDPVNGTRPDGFGLVSMRERAEILGGEVEVQSQPGEGTRVLVRLP